ncbi:hypothetical protein NTP67_14250 [Providencia rettgeri]|uniref:hypothetical protein n=1 Tax=Providencia rettgeri TaxID=587 RepID=UPI00221FA63A|nr:hypothetical protein [Providencia rettgeri]ELR5279996.1 hypothetical protein [Providencia rettgeri]UYV40387.1 hypothetical protein NTP67_14250 [Providencia rettgeri]
MKGFGIFLLIIGAIASIVSFNMDVSVASGLGGRINNIGLISDRQNYIIGSLFISFCGLLIILFGKKSVKESDIVNCPMCAEKINKNAIKCKHCGSSVGDLNKRVANNGLSASDEALNALSEYFNGGFDSIDEKAQKVVKKLMSLNQNKSPDEIEVMYLVEVSEVSKSLTPSERDKLKDKYIYWLHNQ